MAETPPWLFADHEATPLASEINTFPAPAPVGIVNVPFKVVAPVTVNVPPTVVFPVTPKVLDNVVAPVTPNVPPSVVAPVPTVNVLIPLTAVFPFKVVAPVTPNVPPSDVAPVPTVNVLVPLTAVFPLNVLAPAKVCAAVVTTPPFVPSAGARFNTFDVMLAPLAVEDPKNAPTLVAALDVVQAGIPLAKANICPSVPLANKAVVPAAV